MDDRQYFAQLDENNIVTNVACVTREFLEANPDRYAGRWVETFYDHPTKAYAGIGFIYDEATDNFVGPPPPPKPDTPPPPLPV